jgi:hypothetical protein
MEFHKRWITPKTIQERIAIARQTMPQGLEVITVRLDATHTPVNYDRSFFPEAKKKGWYS